MSEWSVPRSSPRYAIQIPFLHKPRSAASTRAGVGWTCNLSEGGACVELAEPLRPHMPLWGRLQTDGGLIEMQAKVAWARNPGSPEGGILHGVTFTQITPDQLSALQTLILSKGLVRHPRVRLPLEAPVTCWRRGESGSPLFGGTRDVSRGGLLLRLPQVVPPETRLDVTLHHPSWLLMVEGAIVWVAPPEGRTPGGPIRHGFRFTQPTWSTSLALGLLLTEPLRDFPPLLAHRKGMGCPPDANREQS
jgi:hypothetical protein